MDTLRLSPGSLFANRFEIEHAAGSGGMGTVYRAIDRYSGDTVALKLLHGGTGRPHEGERFTREARVLSELRHPGIVTYVAHGQTPDGQRFLAMEWLDGHDLASRLNRGPLSLRDSLQLTIRVADALAVAHQRGIVHRDLKPANLFLPGGEIARVKLLDFGIARRVAASQRMTQTGAVLGTPEYMAPEQARGSRELTAAADLFSLGCVLYECLTGQPPFVADHVAAVLMRILFDEPAPIESLRPGIPAALVTLLGRLLAKDPQQRGLDAAVLRAELAGLGELPEPALALTVAGDRGRTESFAEQEQDLFSIVLAAPGEEDLELGATRTGSDVLHKTQDRRVLLQSLAGIGGSAEFLANGNLVVTVPPLGSAYDQAVLAARAALLIKEQWPDAVVSMATGRGIIRGRTAVGEVVELAARSLKSSTSPGKTATGVRIDPLSAQLLHDRFVLAPHPDGALLLYEERDVDTSRLLLGKPTPCVGRETELAVLDAQLTGCIEESEARAVLFVAPPGGGKSRLRHEFVRRVEKRSDKVTLLMGRGELTGAGTPYGIFRSAVCRLCGIAGSESIEAQQERLRSGVAQHIVSADLDRIILFLGELCSIPFSEEGRPILQAARRDPKLMRDRLRQTVVEFFAAAFQLAPVILILDDLQWSDGMTVAALDDVLREHSGAPLFVLAFARPEVHAVFPKLWPSHKVQQLPLKGLSKKACERLVRQVLGSEISAEVIARAVEQSAGNALFLEELIRSIAEGKPGDQPETVLAMLQARLAKLDGRERRVVRAASVFGRTFWSGGVAAVLGIPSANTEVEEALTALTELELVQTHAQSRLAGEQEYGFRHVLVCDAAYSLLTDEDLAAGHRQAARFLESAGESNAASIAQHFQRGADKQNAAACYLRAAEEGLRRGAFTETLHWVDCGLLCAQEDSITVKLRSLESFPSLILGRYDRVLSSVEHAFARSRPGSLGWCRLVVGALAAAMSSQDVPRALSLVSQIIETEPDEEAVTSYIEVLNLVSASMVLAAPWSVLQTLVRKLEVCTELAEACNPLIRRCLHATRAMLCLRREPRPWTAVLECQRAVALAKEAGDLLIEQANRVVIQEYAWLDLGDLEQVYRRLLASEAEALSSPIDLVGHHWRHLIASTLCLLPDERGWSQAEAKVAPLLTGNHPMWPLLAQSVLAQVALLRGQLVQAEAQAHALMQRFPADWALLLPAASVQIRALLGLGRAPEATAVAEKVLSTFPLLTGAGHTELELRVAASEAFRESGDLPRAQAELRETLRQIQLRADDISEPSWRHSYLTRNPHCVRAQSLASEWELDAATR